MKTLRIALVDDHSILRDGLKLICSELKNTEVVIEASNGKEFIDQLDEKKPDLAIIDINMPVMGGEDAVKIAKQKYPKMKIIILSMYSDEQFYNTFNELNVDGYLLKEVDYNEFDRAINIVTKGGKYFSQQLLMGLLKNRPKTNNYSITLSERESQILKLLCEGLSTNEIAEKLFVSVRTVEKHRSEMLLKTGSSNSVSLVIFAIKNGLVFI